MQRIRRFPITGIIATLTLAFLVGCAGMPDSSSPTLSITRAEVRTDGVSLAMRVDNPSDFDLELRSIDWTLIYGPMPVSGGLWTIAKPLPSKASLEFTKEVAFDSPPLDPSAAEIELSGEMKLGDRAGHGNMAIENASFRAVRRVPPKG